MTEGAGPGQDETGSDQTGADQTGSIGEEAAKLFEALQEWAATTGAGHLDDIASDIANDIANDIAGDINGDINGDSVGRPGADPGGHPDWGTSAAAAAAAAAHRVNEHIATGGADCRYCPVCQLISAVRGTPPEVRQHLVSAAGSLMHAVSGLLATPVPDQGRRRDPVQKIDLDDEWEDS